MSNTMEMFKTIILVQLFFSFCITGIVYGMQELPDAKPLNFVTGFSDVTDEISLDSVALEVEESFTRQTNIPVIELGAMLFYSGNILIDLMLNFIFALPEMIGLIVQGIQMLLGVDNYLWALAQLFSTVIITVMYFIGLMQLLTNIRSGRAIT